MTKEVVADQDQDGVLLPPAVLALSERQRRFVIALFEAPKRKGASIWAAAQAGYGTGKSTRNTLRAQAGRLMMDSRVLAAIREYSHARLRAMPPAALSALERLLDRPDHKDHGRAIAMILDRSDPVQTTQNIRVEHEHNVSIADIERTRQRIAELAHRSGLLLPPAAEPVDAEFCEVSE